jgi:hypothetical protein
VKNQYPRLIVPDVDDVVGLDTKEMIGIHPQVFGFNFTNDTDEKSHSFESSDKIIKNKKHKKQVLICGKWVINDNYIMAPMDTIVPRMDIKVIVDTTYIISRNKIEYKNHIPKINPKLIVDVESEIRLMQPFFDEENKLKKAWIECYPVLIYNRSKKTAIVGHSMIQEAKDEKGKWRPIEFIAIGRGEGCCPMPSRKLFSKKYLGSSIVKYHGSFKTRLRLKYMIQWNAYYSNEFTGYINRSQFDKKPFIEQFNFWKSADKDLFQSYMDFAFLDYQKYKNSVELHP